MTLPQSLFLLAIVFFPTVYGWVQIKDYLLVTPADLFELMLSGAVPLIFPLLAVLIFPAPFSTRLVDRFIFYTRTRISIESYLVRVACANGLLTFSVFFLMVIVTFLSAFYLAPAAGVRFDLSSAPIEQLRSSQDNAFTFSQLLSIGNGVFALVYATWVGLFGAIIATVGLIATLLIPQRVVALALPTIIYFLENFGLAVVGLEVFRSVTSVFPFALEQQAIATTIPALIEWVGYALIGVIILVSRRFSVETLL